MNLRDEWRERVAEALPCTPRCYPATRSGHSNGCTRSRHTTADQLLAPGGVVAGIVAEARAQAVEDGRVIHRGIIAQATREAREDGAAEVRARVEAVDFTVRRLGTATGDPWVGGWNDALAVCQDDLRLALDAPISAPVRRSEPLSGSGEGASTPDVSRGGERGEG